MSSTAWPVYSPFAREHYGRGKDDGLAEGEAKGEARGEAKGEANAVLRVLAIRGIAVSDDIRALICACADTQQLDTWLDRAVTATSIDDLFD